MKYFLDTEFIEDGKTIDLLSIALVAEDSRSLYLQNSEAQFTRASDWVWRNVFPHLQHFAMQGRRSCCEQRESYDSGLGTRTTTCCKKDCPWRKRREISEEILAFCDITKHGDPEFWGYYSAYDWVAFCQLFGTMIDLPEGYPMFCRDIIQLCEELKYPKLPAQESNEHNALSDALWNKRAYEFLRDIEEDSCNSH